MIPGKTRDLELQNLVATAQIGSFWPPCDEEYVLYSTVNNATEIQDMGENTETKRSQRKYIGSIWSNGRGTIGRPKQKSKARNPVASQSTFWIVVIGLQQSLALRASLSSGGPSCRRFEMNGMSLETL